MSSSSELQQVDRNRRLQANQNSSISETSDVGPWFVLGISDPEPWSFNQALRPHIGFNAKILFINLLIMICCSTQAEIVSFWINIFILFINYLFFIRWVWQVHRAYPKYRIGQLMYFTELFREIKNKPQCLLYPVIFLSLRVLSWVLIVVFAWINITLKIVTLSVLHSAVALYLLIVKPFEEVKNSIYKSMSQMVMAVFCIIWIYYNTEDRWNTVINWVCTSIIVITSFISSIISIVDLIKVIKLKIQLCFRKRKINEIKENKIKLLRKFIKEIKTKLRRTM